MSRENGESMIDFMRFARSTTSLPGHAIRVAAREHCRPVGQNNCPVRHLKAADRVRLQSSLPRLSGLETKKEIEVNVPLPVVVVEVTEDMIDRRKRADRCSPIESARLQNRDETRMPTPQAIENLQVKKAKPARRPSIEFDADETSCLQTRDVAELVRREYGSYNYKKSWKYGGKKSGQYRRHSRNYLHSNSSRQDEVEQYLDDAYLMNRRRSVAPREMFDEFLSPEEQAEEIREMRWLEESENASFCDITHGVFVLRGDDLSPESEETGLSNREKRGTRYDECEEVDRHGCLHSGVKHPPCTSWKKGKRLFQYRERNQPSFRQLSQDWMREMRAVDRYTSDDDLIVLELENEIEAELDKLFCPRRAA